MDDNRQEDMINVMLDAVSNKYNKEFSVEYFLKAKDYSYTNILTLSADGYVFNAYQSGDDQNVSDDLIRVVINKRVTEQITDGIGGLPSDVRLHVNMLFYGIDGLSYDEARTLELGNLIKSEKLVKAVAVVETSKPFSECKETIYNIYRYIINYGPEYLDFEMIELNGKDAELDKMLNNLPGYYDSDWSKYSAVSKSAATSDKSITSPEDLIGG